MQSIRCVNQDPYSNLRVVVRLDSEAEFSRGIIFADDSNAMRLVEDSTQAAPGERAFRANAPESRIRVALPAAVVGLPSDAPESR